MSSPGVLVRPSKTARPGAIAGLVILLVTACGSGEPDPEAVVLAGDTMGTRYRVVLGVELGHRESERLSETIEASLDGVDRAMSTWRSDSEVSSFSRSTSTEWFAVSPATVEVVGKALEISRITEGAFDVTVAPLVDLWEFGPHGEAPRVPDPELVAETSKNVGWRHLEAREAPPALRKAIPRLTIDLSAIAKGYAVDVVAEALSGAGIENYLVEIGGEIRGAGRRLDGRPWRVGVEVPGSGLDVREVLELEDRSLATSGDYRKYFVVEGKRYSHVIDPRTGMPALDAPASVSVVMQTCMEADALATALMVMGGEAGLAFAEQLRLPVQILSRSEGDLRRGATEAFERLIADRPEGE